VRITEKSQRSVKPKTALGASRVAFRTGLLLLILALSVLLSGERQSELSRAFPYTLTDRQRFGFVATSHTWREDFDVSQLRGGWYVDAMPPECGASPEGMDRAMIIRVRNWVANPQVPWLESMVDSHPASLWLVGNEPDCIWQDNLLPDDYAHVYHEIYTAIKGRDPTALVSPGGIVQPTPLRLQWLDRALLEYESFYQEPMPVDVWNIHNAILREYSYRCDPALAWGADIPPGFDQCMGVWREVQDNDRLDLFEQQIWAFRQLMANNGYADKPLIVSEYGILMPVEYGFDPARVNAFMDATFQFLAETTHLDWGDPNDGHRLVQRWAWFSLDNPPYDWNNPQPETYNGNLFDPYTTDITGYGVNYATHTASFAVPDYVDLSPGSLWFEPLGPVGEGETVNRTVGVEIWNLGSQDSGPFDVRLAYTGPASGQLQRAIPNLPAGSAVWISFELAQLSIGAYDILVWVDPDDAVSEVTECDNQSESIMVVPTDLMYLPMIARRR
jgi:hypothetical protein